MAHANALETLPRSVTGIMLGFSWFGIAAIPLLELSNASIRETL
jgi:hypothetical protein